VVAAAEGHEENQVALIELPARHRLMQRDGDAGRGHVAVAVEVDDEVLKRHPHPLRHGLDDAEIGLMRNEPADLLRLAPGELKTFLRRAVHRTDRLPVNFLALHLDTVELVCGRIRRQRHAAAAGGQRKNLRLRSIRAEMKTEDAPAAGPMLEDDRARAVAKEHAGIAVLPVHNGGELLRAHDEDRLINPARDELVRRDHGVQKTGAGRLQVEGRRAGGADLALNMAGGGGEDSIGRAGRDDDQVDGERIDPGSIERLLRRLRAHVRGEFVLRRNAPLANAGARPNPLVARIDCLFQLRVRENAAGQVGAGGNDGGATSH
jgi:hypothetical protein